MNLRDQVDNAADALKVILVRRGNLRRVHNIQRFPVLAKNQKE